VYYEGMDVFEKICTGLENFMNRKGYDKVSEMVGKAHEI